MSEYVKEDLLSLYFEMLEEERHRQFADTAHTAEMFGISQRTIQHWIECGWIQSVNIGKKHQVYLNSVKEYLTRINEPT